MADDDHWACSDTGVISNKIGIDFGVPDVDWGYTPYFAICDAATEGNVYGFGQFTNPQSLGDQYLVRLPVGAVCGDDRPVKRQDGRESAGLELGLCGVVCGNVGGVFFSLGGKGAETIKLRSGDYNEFLAGGRLEGLKRDHCWLRQ